MLDALFTVISLFFNSVWGFGAFVAVSFILIFATTNNRKLFLISMFATLAIGFGLSAFLGIQRPCVEQTSLILCPFSNGFPSMHTLIAVSITLGAIGTFIFWPMLFFSLAIALSRVWLGVHSIDQIGAGAGLAVMVFLAVFEINHRLYGGNYKFNLDEMLDENLLNKKVF